MRSPLIAASGTVGSVYEWAGIADTTPYGAAVAKSVSGDPWPGRVGDARDADVQDTPDAAGRGNTTRSPRDVGPGSPQTVSGKGGFTRS